MQTSADCLEINKYSFTFFENFVKVNNYSSLRIKTFLIASSQRNSTNTFGQYEIFSEFIDKQVKSIH